MRYQNAPFKDRMRLLTLPTNKIKTGGWMIKFKIMDGECYVLKAKKLWR